MITFIVLFILGFIIGKAMTYEPEECPREILGYNCRGSECNHDPDNVFEAKRARGLL